MASSGQDPIIAQVNPHPRLPIGLERQSGCA